MTTENQTHRRCTGDTRTPLGVVLMQSGTVVDLTGLTIKFKMFDSLGNVKVAETTTGVSVIDAVNGEVQYDFQAADVLTAGAYFAYFTVYQGSERDTFPIGRLLRIEIVDAA